MKRPADHFSEQHFWPIIQIWRPPYKNFIPQGLLVDIFPDFLVEKLYFLPKINIFDALEHPFRLLLQKNFRDFL